MSEYYFFGFDWSVSDVETKRGNRINPLYHNIIGLRGMMSLQKLLNEIEE